MNNNRDLFMGHLTAEPELNRPPKGTAMVNVSLANKSLQTSEVDAKISANCGENEAV